MLHRELIHVLDKTLYGLLTLPREDLQDDEQEPGSESNLLSAD